MKLKKLLSNLKTRQKEIQRMKREAYPFNKNITNPEYIRSKFLVEGFTEGELRMIQIVLDLIELYK